MELLGYKLEGIHQNKFTKAHEVSDAISVACLNEDFLSIKKSRGALWDDLQNMKKRIASLPSTSFKDQMSEFFRISRSSYYENIFRL